LKSHAAPIIERAPLPLVEVQGGTHIVSYVNSAYCALLGKPRAELLGRPFADICPGGNDCVPILDQVYQTGEAVTLSRADPDDPNSSCWLYAMWPALDTSECPVGVIIQLAKAANFHKSVTAVNEALLIAGLRQHELTEAAEKLSVQLRTEIAERSQVETALRESTERLASADRQKDEFLAMLAHELRNPLAPIKTAAQVIQKVGTLDPIVGRARDMIERQTDRLIKLVDDLLDVSRIIQGKVSLQKVHMDLAKAVTHALESCDPLIKSRKHQLVVDLRGDAPLHIDADPLRVEQIIGNLLINAAKYTPPHGTIHVSASYEKGMAVVRVRDNGIGIEPHMLSRIFNLFTQVEKSLERTQGGLGLGLKLARDLVALHGGTLEVTSDGINRGSEFIVKFPALSAADSSLMVAVKDDQVVPTRRRLLIVDDSDDIRESMSLMLTMTGHSVDLASDGEQGVEKVLQTHPDVALIDIGLPKIDGYEVARRIRRGPGGQGIVLLALSGYGQAEDKRKALDAGFDAHLTKPIDADDLNKLLNEIDKFQRTRTLA